jgi:hypothetical protein
MRRPWDPNYTMYMLNKHSSEFVSVLTNTYDFIIDNNLASLPAANIISLSCSRIICGH